MALALAACAPASVTPASSPTLAQPTAPPSGAEVKTLPTWTPQPTDAPVAPREMPCPDLTLAHSEITLAPIPNDGDLVAITNQTGLYVFDLKSGMTNLVFDNWVAGSHLPEQPFWSPNGKKLALVLASPMYECHATQLVLADAEKHIARVVSSSATHIQILGWTQDGRRLLFWTGSELLAADATGTEGVKPYSLPNAPPEKIKQWFAYGGAISHDLTRVAFVPALPSGNFTTLHLVNLRTGVEQTIEINTSGMERIQWSPDGRYVLAKVGLSAVFLIDTQNNNLARQLDFLALPLRNSWSADSARLALVLAEDGGHDLPRLGIYTIKTGQLKIYPMGFMGLADGAWRK